MRTRYQVLLWLLVSSSGVWHLILSCTLLLPACFPNGAAVFAKRLESAAPFLRNRAPRGSEQRPRACNARLAARGLAQEVTGGYPVPPHRPIPGAFQKQRFGMGGVPHSSEQGLALDFWPHAPDPRQPQPHDRRAPQNDQETGPGKTADRVRKKHAISRKRGAERAPKRRPQTPSRRLRGPRKSSFWLGRCATSAKRPSKRGPPKTTSEKGWKTTPRPKKKHPPGSSGGGRKRPKTRTRMRQTPGKTQLSP